MTARFVRGRFAIALAATLSFALLAAESFARNPLYYGTPRGVSARTYSGIYQAQRPNVVPTYTLPVYGGGGFNSFYRGGLYGRSYGAYGPIIGGPIGQQPVVIYPPAVTYGFGF